jgi:hypothetical protein
MKRLSWFDLFIFAILIWFVYQVLNSTIPTNFTNLKDVTGGFPIKDSWRYGTNFANIFLLLILFFNLFLVKKNILRNLPKFYLIFIMVGLFYGTNYIVKDYTIDIKSGTGRVTTEFASNYWVDYEVKYTPQQIQMATLILSIPSFYSIIILILTNYFWQKTPETTE